MSHAKQREQSLALPPIDLRPLLPPGVRSQGNRPLCVPFSVGAAHEAARGRAAGGRASELCVEPLWSHCVTAGKAEPQGTRVRDVADALRTDGHTLESAWPYNDALAEGTELPPDEAAAAGWFVADILPVPIAHDGIEAMVEATLTAQLAVILLIELTDEFDSPGPGGEIGVPALRSPVSEYHAVVAVGAATNADGDSRRLLVRNSWGPGWGAGGYGWLPHDYLIAFCPQAAVVDPTTLR